MEMTMEQLLAELARERAENHRLKHQTVKADTLSFRVSAKGAVSVYGMGRFPVTLYGEQWEKLLDRSDELRQFVRENKAILSTKAAKEETAAVVPNVDLEAVFS